MERGEFTYHGAKATVTYSLNWGLSDINGKGSDYSDAVEAVNPDCNWIHEQFGDYQGDWASVGFNGQTYYYKQGSFGSCSGCDTMQGIEGVSEAEDFFRDMEILMPIGSTVEEAVAYLEREKKNAWSDLILCLDSLIERLQDADLR